MAAATVGENLATYLPTVSGTAEYGSSYVDTKVKDKPSLQSRFSQPTNTESITLAWLLYDFGGRGATVRSSKLLLTAAQATQNLTLQTVLAGTASGYYAAQAAGATVDASLRVEADAKQTLDAATARYKAGVAPITDQLQATTASAQAVYQRVKAEGSLRVAVGALAVDMSLPADTPLQLVGLDQSPLPDGSFMPEVHDLIEEAVQTHPSVVAARAQWQSALEEVRVAHAQGLPILSLSGSASRSDQPVSESIGLPEYPSVSRDASIGLNVTIPLFDGFARGYKIRQAEAQAESEAEALRAAEQQVASTVWSSFQVLQTATENLGTTDVLVRSARESFKASERRYQSGVGAITDALTAQSALAMAEQQYIQAQLDWRTARIALALNLGRLGFSDLK
jgi:outer membrane protein